MINELKKLFKETPEIAAAYLFGSAAAGEAVVNDLDILILPFSEADFYQIDCALSTKIALATGFETDKIDLIVFDLKMVKPDILFEAVNKGILLTNKSPELLTNKIEALSSYFLENEYWIKEKKRIMKERLEAFCAD